jgi:hypothetical protein
MARRKRVRLDKKGKPLRPRQPPRATQRTEPAPPPSAVCDCPRLDEDDWDNVESDWGDIQFIRTHARAMFGVPIGFDGLRDQLRSLADAAGATIPDDAMLLLGPGRFRRPVLLEVENVDPDAGGVFMPGGVAYSRIMSAPWGEMSKRAKDTKQAARERFGRNPDSLWIWYLTCKDCSSEREYETLFIAHYRDDVRAIS